MHSQIQLLSRKFLDIELHPQSTHGKENDCKTSHMIVVVQDDENPTHWRTKFGIKIENSSEEESAPYVGEIIVAGTFKLAEDFPAEKAKQMVHLNSGAILYGAIRELVSSLTSQSIHGELILPTIDARAFLAESTGE
jgi:preprotein translocase subunit SecB